MPSVVSVVFIALGHIKLFIPAFGFPELEFLAEVAMLLWFMNFFAYAELANVNKWAQF